MEIGSAAAIPSLSLTRITQAAHGGGRVTLPVQPQGQLYARFKHVSGVPASSENGGFSVYKLLALDRMIDQLIRLSGNREKYAYNPGEDGSEISVQTLIDSYSRELHTMLTSSNPYLPQGGSEGILIDFFL